MDDSDRLSALRDELRNQLGAQRCDVWLGESTEIRYHNRALHITCPSGAEMEWLRRRLHKTLDQCVQVVWGPGVPIVYAARKSGDAARKTSSNDGKPEISSRKPATAEGSLFVRRQSASPCRQDRNRDRWTFSSLAVGQSNRLAVATVQSAIDEPGRFSPLFLFGSSGVGKSHLLQAAATTFRESPARAAVLHVTAEQFTSQFLSGLSERTLPSFRQKCRSVDVLLIDDVQFLIGKKATLEELLYTIDALQQRGRQVVLSADRPPNEFPTAASALAAKLAGGLALQIDPPNFQMRTSIVVSIAARVRADLGVGTPELIAQQIVGSARLLAGAVNRLVATSMALGRPITTELASPVLVEFVRQHTPQVKLADVQRAVCEVFGVEPARLKSKEKTRGVVEPRMIAMWLARRYTRAALSEIGEYFGRRSHSTVVAAQKKCDRLVSQKAHLHVGDAAYPIDDAIRRVEAALRIA